MRWLIYIAALVVLLAAVALGMAWHVWHRALPRVEGTVRVEGVQQPVEIVRDRWGVPHIFAASDRDAYYALGWAMAQDRLFQMDMIRHVAQGRLAELFGTSVLDVDKLFRTLGVPDTGARMFRRASPPARAALEAFAAGANAWVASPDGALPPEYTILRVGWEPFAPGDFAPVVGFLTWGLNPAWRMDPLYQQLLDKVGPARAAQVSPLRLHARFRDRAARAGSLRGAPPPAAAPRPALRWALNEASRAVLAALPSLRGSNAWAVGRTRSTTGTAILANDPHMGLSLPGTWYQAHLQTPTQDVAGVFVPGVPFALIGHNRHIAWGFTNLEVDGGDFFRERLQPGRPARVRHRGEWVPLRTRTETLRVRDGEPVTLQVRETPHGPLVHDLLEGHDEPLAYRWVYTVAREANEIDAFHALNRAADWDAFRAALRGFGAVAQRVVYADRRGHVGLQAAGRIPRLAPGDTGTRFRRGWDGSEEWQGFIPFARLPSVLDPPQGYVAAANNPPPRGRAPYYISAYWEPPDRIRRISELLEAQPRHSVEDFQRMQYDTVAVSARELAPLLGEAFAAAPPAGALVGEALELLRGWDGDMRMDSAPAAVFAAFYKHLFHEIFADELGDELAQSLRAWGNFTASMIRAALHPDAAQWLDRQGTAPVEDRADILRAALRKAVAELSKHLGEEPARWRWGELHTLALRHPLGRVPPLNFLFNLGPFPVPGHALTINKGQFRDESYQVYLGPSMRQITDMGRPQSAWAVLPTGQSGLPASDHYGDLTGLWRQGRYHPVLMERDALNRVMEGRLVLTP